MVTWCEEFRPSELRRLGRHLLEVVAPEIAEAELAKRLENEEQQAREKTTLRSKNIGDGMARTTITHPELDRNRLFTFLEAFASPRKADGAISGEEDRIPYPRRLGQAFGALLEHLDPDKLPQHGGDTTTVLVTIGLESLQTQLGTGTIVGGEDLSATAIRRLACNADIIPVVLGGKGEILDLGRSRRLFHPANAKPWPCATSTAGPKAAPSPPAGARPTTLKPWSQGGNTDIDDGVLGCNWHHHLLHDPTFTHRDPPQRRHPLPPPHLIPTMECAPPSTAACNSVRSCPSFVASRVLARRLAMRLARISAALATVALLSAACTLTVHSSCTTPRSRNTSSPIATAASTSVARCTSRSAAAPSRESQKHPEQGRYLGRATSLCVDGSDGLGGAASTKESESGR